MSRHCPTAQLLTLAHRYHYFPRTSTFVLSMSASYEHENLEGWFCQFVERKLERLCSGDAAKESFANQIRNERHAPIREGEIGTHHPDARFRHLQAPCPAVILEVGYSQKSKALSELAHIYITEGYRGTQLVVALDQDYRRSKQIMLKTWRPRVDHPPGSALPRLSIEYHSQVGLYASLSVP